MARFTSKLTLVLGLCVALALAKAANQAAADTRPEVICNNGACYPRIFRPTSDFQEVLEGQEIPGGLHVQMDFESHKKFAKLMDPESEPSNDNSVLVIDTDTPGTFQHQIESNFGMPPPIDLQHPDHDNSNDDVAQLEENSRMNLQSVFDSIPELAHIKDQDGQQQQQQQHQQEQEQQPYVPVARQSDHQIFMAQMDLIKTSPDRKVVLGALEGLADLASDMDFGLRLSERESLNALVSQARCTSHWNHSCDEEDHRLIRSKSALIIGTALQNHEKAQTVAFKNNLHRTLLSLLEGEKDHQVLRRLIFAYGSLVRGGSNNEFIEDQDISRLAELYNQSEDPVFKRKCVYIMSDFADPDMQFVIPNDNETMEDGLNNYTNPKTMTVIEKDPLDVGPWCESLQLENQTGGEGEDQHEDWEIIERAVELLHASYPETCILNNDKVRDEL